MFFVYSFLFLILYPIDQLGHDEFEIRERATEKMKKDYPLSMPSLYLGLFSSDPEIKYRAKLILRQVKADDIIFAKKIASPHIKKLFTNDKYPVKEDSDFLKDTESWIDFCEVLVHYKIYDPKQEIIMQQYREGVYFLMWARAKAVRYGKDPKVGSHILPEIIKPGQEPKKVKDWP
jgi:hypothetical protein